MSARVLLPWAILSGLPTAVARYLVYARVTPCLRSFVIPDATKTTYTACTFRRSAVDTSIRSPAAVMLFLGTGIRVLSNHARLADVLIFTEFGLKISSQVGALRKQAESARAETLLSLGGELASSNCYLELQAGAGGTESHDWTSMLFKMYTRWAETRGFKRECPGRTR